VAIDETRQNGAARRIQALRCRRNYYTGLGTRSDYSPVLDDDNAGPDRIAAKSVYQGTTDNRREHSKSPLSSGWKANRVETMAKCQGLINPWVHCGRFYLPPPVQDRSTVTVFTSV
jgi:hypothetical protein